MPFKAQIMMGVIEGFHTPQGLDEVCTLILDGEDYEDYLQSWVQTMDGASVAVQLPSCEHDHPIYSFQHKYQGESTFEALVIPFVVFNNERLIVNQHGGFSVITIN